LLPMNNPHLDLNQVDDHWEIKFEGRRYVFPARDVMVLPVDNITAERLAEYIWGKIAAELIPLGSDERTTLTVGVEEAPGQAAYFSQLLPAASA
jgi:hypothetical protein